MRYEIHLALCELRVAYRPTLVGILMLSCFIAVSLLGGVWNSGTAPADMYLSGNAVCENTVFKITSCSCYRVSCTEVVYR